MITVKMERKSEKHLALKSFHSLKVDDIVVLMELLNMSQYCELVRNKLLDGDKLLNLTEGKAMLWRPKISIKDLIKVVEDMKVNPERYIEIIRDNRNSRIGSFEVKGKCKEQNSTCVIHEERKVCSDSEKSFGIETTVNFNLKKSSDTCINKYKQSKESLSTDDFFLVNVNLQRDTRHNDSVDMIIKSFKPERTFLYSLKDRNNPFHNPYLPMDMNIQKDHGNQMFKTVFEGNFYKRFNHNNDKINLCSYDNQEQDYCIPCRSEDRGYYAYNIKRGNANESLNKHKFLNTNNTPSKSKSNFQKFDQNIENSITEHFYEDLNDNRNYYVTEAKDSQLNKRFQFYPLSKSACMLRVSEIVSILSCPKPCKFKYSFKKNDKTKKHVDVADIDNFTVAENYKINSPEGHKKLSEGYEEKGNSAIYDVIRPNKLDKTSSEGNEERMKLEVEDYLEPIKPIRDYSDVVYETQDESIVTSILKMFENNFKLKKDQSNRKSQSTENDGYLSPPLKPIPVDKKRVQSDPKSRGGVMADRPLPVPVENEFYYMQVDRGQAQELLMAHADGTFILRPSSQEGYVYSISLVYQQRIFNLGVRRRSDNRLALGFAKNSEQSFQTIKELIEYHYKEKLILIVKGEKVGSVLLKKLHG